MMDSKTYRKGGLTNSKRGFSGRITLLMMGLFMIGWASVGQEVRLFLKNGDTMNGTLIALSMEKTEIDPEGSVSVFVLQNNELDSLTYLKTGITVPYPITSGAHLKSGKSNAANPPRNRSVFSFGFVSGRSSTITTMAFDGFSETKFKPAFMAGGSVMYFLTNFVAFEVLVSNTRSRITENSDDLGTLSMTSLIFNYKMQTKPRKKAGVGFNMDIGLGVAFTNYTNGSAIHQIEQEERVSIEVETNNPLVFNMGMGLDVFVCKQVSLGVDLRLLIGNVQTDWKFNGISTPISEKLYASSFILGFEARYWLDH